MDDHVTPRPGPLAIELEALRRAAARQSRHKIGIR